jgi:uncharacterized membrane protein YgcG
VKRWQFRLGYALAVVVAAGLALPVPARAQAGERILGYDVDLRIEQAGTLLVTERIDYDFGAADRHGIFRDVPVRFHYDDRYDRVYRVDVLSVQGTPGTPARFELSSEGSYLRIKIGDPDRTITGRHGYTVTYRVSGALNGFADHDELYWNAVGTHWAVPIERATVRLAAPAAVTRVACYAGLEGATTPCASARADGRTASFGAAGLGDARGLTVVAAFPAGAVPAPRPILDERWTVARAFSPTPATLGASGGLAVLLVGGLLLLVARGWQPARKARRRRGPADAEAAPVGLAGGAATVEPAPPDGLRPAQLGLLADKEVAKVAVSATIVDLAVRGYLRIEELDGGTPSAPPKRWRGGAGPDWRVVKLKEPDRDLAGYERELIADLFRLRRGTPSTQHGGDWAAGDADGLASVRLSSLRQRFHQDFAELQRALYDDGMQRGWFAARPDRVRAGWLWIGVVLAVVGAAAAVALAAWTSAGLVPVPILLVGLALVVGARWMPSRTAAGRALARRVRAFRTYLTTPGLAAGADGADLFSPYLPYAIVFGLTRPWTAAFAERDRRPQVAWYLGHGLASPYWYASMHSFTRSSESTLTSAPTSGGSGGSGFGGGGFSGGGGGGGGGGSW